MPNPKFKQGQYTELDFKGFSPDLDTATPGIFVASNSLVPNNKGFFSPQLLPVSRTNALPAKCLGAFTAYFLNGTFRQFAGTNTHLYENVAGTWTEVDGGTTFNATQWRFAQFGNHTIAVDGVDAPVFATDSGNFSTLGGSPPVAKLVASISNNFLFMANDTSFSDEWTTCAQGNDGNWTPNASTQASQNRLWDNSGPITGIKPIGANLTLAIYKRDVTYLGQYVAPPVIWQFIKVSSQVGALTQESIVDIGNIHVFPGVDDFYLFDGSNTQRLESPIKKYFYNIINYSAIQNGTAFLIGRFDRIKNVVSWHYPTTGTTMDTYLAWNIKSNHWTVNSLSIENALLPEYPDLPPTQAIFDLTHTMKTFTGGADPAATFTTGDMGDGVNYQFLSRIRPKFQTAPLSWPSISATVLGRQNLGDTQTTLSTGQGDPSGFINTRGCDRYLALQINLGASCEIGGMHLDLQDDGVR